MVDDERLTTANEMRPCFNISIAPDNPVVICTWRCLKSIRSLILIDLLNNIKFPDTAEFGGISVNRSKIVDLQGGHPRVGGDDTAQTELDSHLRGNDNR